MNQKIVRRVLPALSAGALILSFASCTPSDTQTQQTSLDPSTAPQSISQIVAYFNTAADKVKTDRPEASVSTSVSIPDDGVQTSDELLARIFPLFRDQMSLGTSRSGERGSDLTDVAPVAGQSWGSRLERSAVEWATCTVNGEEFKIVIRMRPEENPAPLTSAHGKAFEIHDKQAILDEINAKGADFIHVDDYTTAYEGCYIYASINGVTGEMMSVTYEKNLTAQAQAECRGALASLGTQDITMKLQESMNCTYTWASPEDAAE